MKFVSVLHNWLILIGSIQGQRKCKKMILMAIKSLQRFLIKFFLGSLEIEHH